MNNAPLTNKNLIELYYYICNFFGTMILSLRASSEVDWWSPRSHF